MGYVVIKLTVCSGKSYGVLYLFVEKCPKLTIEGVKVTIKGDKATYTCSKGYFLIGPSERRCTTDEVWSESSPECRSKSQVTSIMSYSILER